MMLKTVRKLLDRQRSKLRNQTERDALAEGTAFFTDFYAKQLCHQLTHDATLSEKQVRATLDLLRLYAYEHYKWVAREMNRPVKPKPKPPLMQRAMRRLFGRKKIAET